MTEERGKRKKERQRKTKKEIDKEGQLGVTEEAPRKTEGNKDRQPGQRSPERNPGRERTRKAEHETGEG